MPFIDFSVNRLAGRTPPARSYLWVVDITPPVSVGGNQGELLSLQARSVGLPGMTNEEIEIQYMNSRFWIAGRRNWDAIDVVFMENESGEISNLFYQWNRLMYDVDGFGEQAPPAFYKTRLDVELLTTQGESIAEWIIQGAWPTTVGPVDLSYETEEVVQFTVSFRFDYWTRTQLSAGIQNVLTGAGGILQAAQGLGAKIKV